MKTSTAAATGTTSHTAAAEEVRKAEPAHPRIYAPRAPMESRLEPPEPFSADERHIVEQLAKQLCFLTAVVAADPNENYPARSVAARVRQAFAELDENTRARSGDNARRLLAKRDVEKRRYFGAFASSTTARDEAVRQEGLPPGLAAGLRAVVRQRVDAQRSQLKELMVAQQSALLAWMPSTKTTLQVGRGLFTDTPSPLAYEATMNEPEVLDFVWSTEEEDAEEAIWELRQPPSTNVVASGTATNAPGGTFSIDFRPYLPQTPPHDPRLYHVRVYPRTAKHIIKEQGATPGSGSYKQAATIVGAPSPPVAVFYAASDRKPQVFDFPVVYLKMDFHLDHIEMIEDQFGPGAEEFHIAGFIKEVGGTSGQGAYHKIGPTQATLDPDGNRKHNFVGLSYPFQLGYPSTTQWPRVYTVVLTMMEEDGGEEIGEWLAKFWDMTEDILKDAISDYVRESIEEMAEELIEEVLISSAENAAIASGVAAGIASGIAAVVVYVAAEIISAIIADMEDDYYGTKPFVVLLASNRTDNVTAFAGPYQLSGQLQSDGSYILAQKGRFYGAPGKGSASAFDGVVELAWHWRLSQAQQV